MKAEFSPQLATVHTISLFHWEGKNYGINAGCPTHPRFSDEWDPRITGSSMSHHRQRRDPVTNLDRVTKGLERWYGGHDLHFITCSLLSTQAGACNLRAPRSIPAGAGARPATVSFCHDRVRGDARAFPSPHDRAGGGRSFRGDESRQRAFHKTAAPRRGPYGADLAKAVLRFQRLQFGETHREASVHASQSREARSCDGTRGLKWSSFRAYACGEGGLVRVNCQEWPLTISYFASRSHSFENRSEEHTSELQS